MLCLPGNDRYQLDRSFILYIHLKYMENTKNIEYRKIQGLVGEQSFSVVLPKRYATDLRIRKGDFVKVSQSEGRIIIEKA